MIRRAAAFALLVLTAACAARVPPAPPPLTTLRYPDFVTPAVPPGLGSPAVLERHQAGWQWLQAGDLRAAERNFSAALKGSESFYPAEVGLGYVALAQKNPKAALNRFDNAVVQNPRYAPALAGRADALLALGQQEEAAISIEAALQADPTLTPLRNRLEVLRFRGLQEDINRARSLAASGRLDDARVAYQGALAASPQSPFLHRELADVERRAGNLDTALEHASKAAELDPEEARTHVLLADIHEARGDFPRAADALAAAVAVSPDEKLRERLEALRSRAAFDAMPEEYRAIGTSPNVTRAQLAALLAVRLEPVLARSRRTAATVITDTRGHWAANYILAATRAGVMEVYANYTFQPDAPVRRVDLADAVSRTLELIAQDNPQLAAKLRDAPKRTFPDVGPRNLNHAAVAAAVHAGVMTTAPDGSFGLTRVVSGAEAIAAVERLQELGGQRSR